MYLHIGNGKSIKKKKIIGIFDLDTSTVSKISKKFISESTKKGKVEYLDFDLPRSFILVEEKKGDYSLKLSRISSQGLKQRSDGNITEE